MSHKINLVDTWTSQSHTITQILLQFNTIYKAQCVFSCCPQPITSHVSNIPSFLIDILREVFLLEAAIKPMSYHISGNLPCMSVSL